MPNDPLVSNEVKRAGPNNNKDGGGEPETKSISQAVKIHTVDMYQGDENDFVIVSLVRSNHEKKIGFLAEMNRRCVAQSRARCGVYFIGNCAMYYGHATWKPMLSKLGGMGCIGEAIGIVCTDHPQYVFFIIIIIIINFITNICIVLN